MKKLFSVILSIVFLLSVFANLAFATEIENQITNIASQGVAYSSSEKNSLWTPVKTINDGVYGSQTWEGWECAYPTVQKGQDTSKGFDNEYCGIDFGTKFFAVSEVKVNLGIHRLLGGQNMSYGLMALVEGKWQTVATFKDSDTTPHNTEKYPTYEDVIADETAGHRTVANYTVKLGKAVTSNNFRLCISEFGKNYEGGDVQVFPYIYELELYGKEVEAPEIVLPEGATSTTNIAWYSYPQASSSLANCYPFLAIDEDEDTYWSPAENDSNPTYTLVFDKKYSISKLDLILANNTYDLIVSILVNGQYQEILAEPERSIEGENTCIHYEFEATDVTGAKVEFKGTEKIELVAFEAHLAEASTYYFDKRFDGLQITSASGGNLAIIGKPYASTGFTPYSNIDFINDGSISKQWFTGTIDTNEHCGLTFDFPQKISKAVIAVKTPSVAGTEIMSFEIQALVNGEYVKLAEGKSYNKEEGYKTTYTFDEVETTDIRVVITEMGGAIPNIAELELYSSSNTPLPMFSGIRDYTKNEGMNCIEPDVNKVIEDHICEENPNTFVPVIISISVLAIMAIAIIVLVVIKKRNKEV